MLERTKSFHFKVSIAVFFLAIVMKVIARLFTAPTTIVTMINVVIVCSVISFIFAFVIGKK
jgi:hypothetical protein